MAIFTNAKKGRDEGGTYLMDLAFADPMADAVTLELRQTDATDAILPTVERKDNLSNCIVEVTVTEKLVEEIASTASVPCPETDTASATASVIASAEPETASEAVIAFPPEQDIKECAEWLALAEDVDTVTQIRNLFAEVYQDYGEQFFQAGQRIGEISFGALERWRRSQVS
ncbi:hypothetical protein NG791_27415 [Laspinema sp. D1]|uniref:hypothetical protein n=1 Tax=Laspinema palackyanum TaxID=3231601 RepID=UPI00348BB23A|nr:hypothetical protein [Laspinema sp. D2b]